MQNETMIILWLFFAGGVIFASQNYLTRNTEFFINTLLFLGAMAVTLFIIGVDGWILISLFLGLNIFFSTLTSAKIYYLDEVYWKRKGNDLYALILSIIFACLSGILLLKILRDSFHWKEFFFAACVPLFIVVFGGVLLGAVAQGIMNLHSICCKQQKK